MHSVRNVSYLIYREEEHEMLPLCVDQGIAVTPYSPLASGRLARDWSETTQRYETDPIAKQKYDATADADKLVVEHQAEMAEKHGVTRTLVALAWLLHKRPVVAPVIGATKIAHLEDAVKSIDVQLEPEDIAYMEEPYVPHPPVGLIPYGGQLLSARR